MASVIAFSTSTNSITYEFSGLAYPFQKRIQISLRNNSTQENFGISYQYFVNSDPYYVIFDGLEPSTYYVCYHVIVWDSFGIEFEIENPPGCSVSTQSLPVTFSVQAVPSYTSVILKIKSSRLLNSSESPTTKAIQINFNGFISAINYDFSQSTEYDFSMSNLQSGTTYGYSVLIANDVNFQNIVFGSGGCFFTTKSYTLTIKQKTPNSITFNLSGFDTQYPLKQITPYIGTTPQQPLYLDLNFDQSLDINFVNLNENTSYRFSIIVLAQDVYGYYTISQEGVAVDESTLSSVFICEISNITSNSATVSYVSGLSWLDSSVTFNVFLNNVQQSNVSTFSGTTWNYTFSNLNPGSYLVSVQFNKNNQIYQATNSQGGNLQFTISSQPPPVSGDGYVKIFTNGDWYNAQPYIFTDGNWHRAEAYVFSNGDWRKTTGN